METRARPYRSVLYIPGSNGRALEKAKTLPVDAIIFDLEDAVSIEAKDDARELLAETLSTADYGPRAKLARINGFDTDWGAADLDVLAVAKPEAVLLPKVNSKADIEDLARRLDTREETADTQIWAMMETPLGMLNALEIAQGPRMAGFIMGTNDLAKELNCRFRADRLPMQTSLSLCLLAARTVGIAAVDGVYNAFKDEDGLRAECEQGRDMGFDGKTLIHPAQVAVANDVFAPSEAEIDLAQRQIEAFEDAEREGKGIAVVDGKIVENLHVATAKQILAKAEAIAAIAAE